MGVRRITDTMLTGPATAELVLTHPGLATTVAT